MAVCSEGILAGEMKHGPLALVDDRMPILVVATCDSMFGKMQSVIAQLHARGAQLIVLWSSSDAEATAQLRHYGCRVIQVPLPLQQQPRRSLLRRRLLQEAGTESTQ